MELRTLLDSADGAQESASLAIVDAEIRAFYFEDVVRVARELEQEPGTIGTSAHLLSIARRP